MKSSRLASNKSINKVILNLYPLQEIKKDEITKSLQAKMQEEREMKNLKKSYRIMGKILLF